MKKKKPKKKEMFSLSIPVYDHPISHHRWDDVKNALGPKLWKKFSEWMIGQTCIEQGVYVWDFQRWVKQGMKTQQGKDWD